MTTDWYFEVFLPGFLVFYVVAAIALVAYSVWSWRTFQRAIRDCTCSRCTKEPTNG